MYSSFEAPRANENHNKCILRKINRKVITNVRVLLLPNLYGHVSVV